MKRTHLFVFVYSGGVLGPPKRSGPPVMAGRFVIGVWSDSASATCMSHQRLRRAPESVRGLTAATDDRPIHHRPPQPLDILLERVQVCIELFERPMHDAFDQ